MQTFIARQPILNRQKKIFAYEFVYRPHVEDGRPTDPGQETFQVIFDICTLLNMEHWTKGKKVLIKAAPDLLADVHLQRLPTDKAIIEVNLADALEEGNLAACQQLKRVGYKLAVNVQTADPLPPELIALADFVKVNLISVPQEMYSSLPQLCAPHGAKLIADSVENEEALDRARAAGFEYFQGPFLSRPAKLGLKTIPSVKMHYLQLIQEVNKPNFDFSRIERIIRQDLSLSFNLLRYINSAQYGTSREVRSLRQALALLGETTLRKWVSLTAFSEMGKDKPAEVVAMAATRAKFYEAVAPVVGLYERKDELFMLGMFSMLDAILDCNIAELLKEIPVAEDVKGALMGADNKLHDVYQYTQAYEEGNWHRVWTYAAKLATNEDFLPHFYLEAISWVEHHLYSPLAPAETV